MKGIIDFHTHVFPDAIADRAIAALEANASVKACISGHLSALLASMDSCGIEKSVVCSIATKPAQFQPILEWSIAIRSERIIPLLSLHPDDPDAAEKMRIVKDEGFPGIKMHPFYQDFYLDDIKMQPLYEAAMQHDLMIVMHTGYDIAFPRLRRADPEKIVQTYAKHPGLKLISTHLGAWEQWQEVNALITGRPIYMELSFSLEYLQNEPVRDILTNHPKEYLLFGSDSPWTNQSATLDSFRALHLDSKREAAILGDNARQLLGIG